MPSAYAPLVERVARIPGIRGAFVVATRDGLVVDGRFAVNLRAPAVAALAAKIFCRALASVRGAGLGAVRFVHLDAEYGKILMAGNEDLMIVTVAEPRANFGRARLEVIRAAQALR